MLWTAGWFREYWLFLGSCGWSLIVKKGGKGRNGLVIGLVRTDRSHGDILAPKPVIVACGILRIKINIIAGEHIERAAMRIRIILILFCPAAAGARRHFHPVGHTVARHVDIQTHLRRQAVGKDMAHNPLDKRRRIGLWSSREKPTDGIPIIHASMAAPMVPE